MEESPPAPEAADEIKADIEQLARGLAPIAATRHYPVFSVTQLRDFERCPRLYYARHVLGVGLDERPMLPEAARDEYADEDGLEGDQRILGIIVHKLLEQFAAMTSTTLDDIAQRVARNETFDDDKAEGLATRAVKIVRSFEKSETGAPLLRAGSHGELSFAVQLDSGVMRGRIDRLIEETPPLVVDFKLPHEAAKATRESLEEKYGLQLRAYALAASRLLGADAVRAAIALPETTALFEWTYGKDDFAGIERELVERIGAIMSAEQSGSPASAAGCGQCAVCRATSDAAATRT